MTPDERYMKKRRIFGIFSLLCAGFILVLLTWLFTKVLFPFIDSPKELQNALNRYGWKGYLLLFLLQCLQMIVALIPGEVIEIGAGYAYGVIPGTLICLTGVAIGSSAIFLLTKKFGISLVELFVPRQKILQLRFINTEAKLKRLVFLLFLIPGTPKDILTYFVGLTNLELSEFLLISLLARIPSIVTSTISGKMLLDQHYFVAIIVFVVTGALSGLGYYCYSRYVSKKTTE